jgi:type VI secretion system protein ImpK
MTTDQNCDLQKTLLIPVLSLQPPEPSAPLADVAAAFHINSSNNISASKRKLAADAVCEKILRDAADPTMHANPILAAATALMTMASQLRAASTPKNSIHFSQLLIDAVREFDRNLLHTQLRHETALVARYILCSAIDESVLSTPWGISSGWAHRSLLRLFHNEANGGDRFFALLEHAIQRQHECHDLLELFYMCLSLGFEGRLHLDPRGQDKIETLRMQLFRILYSSQPRVTELATQWRPVAAIEQVRPKKLPLHIVVIAAMTITALGFCGLRLWLGISSENAANAYQHAFQVTSDSER